MPFGAAALASVASAGIGYLGANSAAKTQATAATDAAQIQANAANRASDMQLGMFNTIRGDLTPYRSLGTDALPGYRAMLGIPAPTVATSPSLLGQPDWGAYLAMNPDVAAEAQRVAGTDPRFPTPEAYAQWHYQNYGQQEMSQGRPFWSPDAQPGPAQQPQAPTFDSAGMQRFLESTPGYQFTRDQGMQAITNQLTARGLGGVSGAYGKGLARFVTGLADSTYGSQLDRYSKAVGTGESAATQTGTFGTAATTGAASSLIGGANAQAAGITGAAQASAAGTVGATNAIASGINNAGQSLLSGRLLGMYGGGAAPFDTNAGMHSSSGFYG